MKHSELEKLKVMQILTDYHDRLHDQVQQLHRSICGDFEELGIPNPEGAFFGAMLGLCLAGLGIEECQRMLLEIHEQMVQAQQRDSLRVVKEEP